MRGGTQWLPQYLPNLRFREAILHVYYSLIHIQLIFYYKTFPSLPNLDIVKAYQISDFVTVLLLSTPLPGARALGVTAQGQRQVRWEPLL